MDILSTPKTKVKSANNDAGHAHNLHNFENLLVICTAWGENYQPSNPAIAVPVVGDVYDSVVKSVVPFGAFVEFLPGKQ